MTELPLITDDSNLKRILHRDEQISKIQDVFNNFETHGIAYNLIIKGLTGGGKTSTITHLIKKHKSDSYLYVSANDITSTNQVMKLVAGVKRGADMGELLKKIIDMFKDKKRILIVDELNRINNIQEFFNILNTLYRAVRIPIILLSNNFTIMDNIPEDAKKTLFFENLFFPAYTPDQLYDIVMDRLKPIDKEILDKIPDASIRRICAYSASEKGSARIALELTMRCLLSNDFSEEKIDYLVRAKEEDEWRDQVNKMNDSEKTFLKTLLDSYDSGEQVTSYLLQDKTQFTPSRVSQLITSFEKDYCLISTSYVYKGRKGGYYRVIDMSPNTYAKLIGFI